MTSTSLSRNESRTSTHQFPLYILTPQWVLVYFVVYHFFSWRYHLDFVVLLVNYRPCILWFFFVLPHMGWCLLSVTLQCTHPLKSCIIQCTCGHFCVVLFHYYSNCQVVVFRKLLRYLHLVWTQIKGKQIEDHARKHQMNMIANRN